MAQRKKSRIALLNLKHQMVLVQQGARILTAKRDALMKEFHGMARKVVLTRQRMADTLRLAGKSLRLARAIEPHRGLVTAALAARREISLAGSLRNVWGVKIPSISFPPLRRDHFERGSAPGYRSPVVDETAAHFEDAISALIESAVAENHLSNIGGAVKATSRRVNALEMRVMPELARETAVIRFHLEEQAREETFRMKRFKHLRERRAESLPG